MSYKNGILQISDWQKGVAQNCHTGFADIRNCDISSSPGVLRSNYATKKDSSTTITDLPVSIVKNPNGLIYSTDQDGKVYQATSIDSSWSLVSGATFEVDQYQTLLVWRDYLFIFSGTGTTGVIKTYGPLSGAASWNNLSGVSFNITSGTIYFPSIVGLDDILYIGYGNKIVSIREQTGITFSPTNSASFVFTDNALDLPKGFLIKMLCELGKEIIVGAYIPNDLRATLFPWDRTSSSFRLPITLRENIIYTGLSHNGLVYFFAGQLCTLYVTDGYKIQVAKRLPREQLSLYGTSAIVYPGAMTVLNGGIYFGLTSFSGSQPQGVWSFRDGVLTFENEISTGETGESQPVYIGCLLGLSIDTLLIGWRDTLNNSQGIDSSYSSNSCYITYKSFAVSQFNSIAPHLQPKAFRSLEIRLAKPLTSGQGVQISYRTARNGSWTTLHTFDYATYQGIQNHQVSIGLSVTDIQLKVALTGLSSPELLAVIMQ